MQTINAGDRRMSRRLAVLGLGTAFALFAVLAPANAAAAPKPLASGDTTLALKKSVAGALADAGVAVKPLNPAKAGKKGVRFPVTGGSFDPATARGTIRHSGGLRLQAGGSKLDLRNFTIKAGKRATLSAAVGKNRVTILNLDLSKAKIGRDQLAYRIANVKAGLTGAAANAINATFGDPVAKRGLVLGTATVVAAPESVDVLAEGDTRLTLDPGAAALLTGAGISASPVGPATASGGALAFPITGGSLGTAGVSGEVRHSGGIRLSEGGTTVDLTEFTIKLDGAPDLTALVGASRVSILNLDLSQATVSVGKRNGAVRVEGVRATLTAAAAAALDAAFGVTTFEEGQLLGTTVTHAATG